ncbi:TetR/AcrR family transcriptional regulator [Chamaesiphon sp. VAR_48_metabat_135_sub]|jgi:TetR/AcrR family transcriptional regulator|uniref:TetR/AcrR family transcriptional regulator n=1 Tax=Chamaesiphon sp. VAR_48_metabat_135_sub TaxID=2964699 RepID=UPI00286C17A6|nr:TetR/AcrR family transcriptional regulator [Chamaesiphon sp. VAR_48_metabat_135_sub]
MPAIDKQKTIKATNLTRNSEATKTQILDAAEAEFAVTGLSAARTEAIAAQTGVTKAMIYYYFQSKEELYQAVLERSLVGMLDMAEHLQLDCLPPDAALVRLLTQMLECMSENPRVGSILCLEAIQNKGKYYPKQLGNLLYGTIVKILEQGMSQGVFRQLEPRHTAVNIVGACSFYFTAQENLKYLWPGKRLLGKELLQSHAQESIDLIMAGVRN